MSSKLPPNIEKLRDEQATKFTNEASEELFKMQKDTDVGWSSDEAICLIIEGAFESGFTSGYTTSQASVKELVEAAKKLLDEQFSDHISWLLWHELEQAIAKFDGGAE